MAITTTSPRRAPSLLQRLSASVAAALSPPRITPMREMGVSGTPVWSGYVAQREKSAKWIGRQKYVTIADMAVNTSIIAAGVHYFVNLVSHPQWTVTPADESDEAKEVAEFVEECLQDLTTSWPSVVRKASTFRFYGFGVQEWTAKKRPDGRIGMSSIEPRPQHTIEQWVVADDGSVEGVWQRDPRTGALLGLPRGKFMYLVDDILTDSPEGTGLFRHLAEPWERLKTYYELEARGFERDLRGIPVGRVPYTMIRQAVQRGDIAQKDADLLVRGMEEFVRLQVKQSNTSLTLDSLPYYSEAADGAKVASVPQWGLELLAGGASGMTEVGAAIVRTQHEMARILTAENLMVGETSGNRALSEDKSRNLYLVANAVLGDVAAAVVRDVAHPLCMLNGVPEELYPTCEVEDVAFKDAESVAATLAKMAQAGAVLAPDDPVIEDVRSLLGVSAPSLVATELTGMLPRGTGEEGLEVEPGAEEEVGKSTARTLYVHRPLLNGEDVRAWAASQGIKSTLPAGDMHVTVAFSREPVDWSAIRRDEGTVTVVGGRRFAHQFPARQRDNGALVLRFDSPALEARWAALRAAGASWDFAEYSPHVTLTYSVPEADVASIEAYAGPLVFGPEVFAEVKEDWADGIEEVPTTRRRPVSRLLDLAR